MDTYDIQILNEEYLMNRKIKKTNSISLLSSDVKKNKDNIIIIMNELLETYVVNEDNNNDFINTNYSKDINKTFSNFIYEVLKDNQMTNINEDIPITSTILTTDIIGMDKTIVLNEKRKK